MTDSWTGHEATDSFKKQLLKTVRQTLDSGARVYVMKDVPQQPFDPPRTVALTMLFGRDLQTLGESPAHWQEENHPLSETFEQISKMGATVPDPANAFLNPQGVYGVIKDDEVLYIDAGHLSVDGAKILAPLFRPMIQAN